ncbi:MAG: PEP-CTERM system histidine kinase PrsK [Gammaproteobacteria bacterium]|nr:PEP-CTERM system histidine kinase PrsK [Gammaproteobacteria bacterium]
MMAGAGYYLREFGSSWGKLTQIVFISLAVVLLAVVMFSTKLRAQIRVFLGKHFYRNKYDYRHEWLRLTRELTERVQGEKRFESAVQVLAQIVDARAGALWLRDNQSHYRIVGTWQARLIEEVVSGDTALVRFLQEKGYVINLTELTSHADEYEGLQLPEWLADIPRAWLIVPLFTLDSLMGFIILANPLVNRSINWEDRDLLNTAARQVSSYLAVLQTSDALAEAKQFEVFNRLSAYMVHDLKNIAAELELVARNAVKHKNNLAFLEDAFNTVNNASGDIKRLLDQLRNKRGQTERKVIVELGSLIQEVVAKKQGRFPQPRFDMGGETYFVVAEKVRLANVLAHLIENAQEATREDGAIDVSLKGKDEMHVIEIWDNGQGMDADFVRNRLFKPFDTTKGNAGMGIGMYESREFIRGLGGEIYVTSEPGRGTAVTLHIPASLEPAVPVPITT